MKNDINKINEIGQKLIDHSKGMKTIVFYSPDMDFCLSFRMLLQNTYNITTTTDTEMLMMLVKSTHPDLVIADAPPTERMQNRFKLMRRENGHIRIMLFYASNLVKNIQENFRSFVDEAFSKPIDLSEVTQRIDDLVMHTI